MAHGWSVEASLRVLICASCGFTIDPAKPSGHLKHSHPEVKANDIDQVFREVVLRAYGELVYDPIAAPTEPLEYIEGLAASNNVQFCHRCHRGFTGQDASNAAKCSSFRMHPCNKEDGSVGFTIRHGQSLGSRKMWVQTHPRRPTTLRVTDLWDKFRSQRRQAVSERSPALPDDDRVVALFLRNERWLEHVSSLEVSTALELIERNGPKGIYAQLPARIHAYCASIQSRIHSYPLRRMIGTRP